MKIRIESDVFDIVNRIKEIDDGYYIVLNLKNGKYELHNSNQFDMSYCLTIPYNEIDAKIIDLILSTLISNIDNIIEDIDMNNQEIDNNAVKNVRNYTEYNVREIYKYFSNS